MAPTALKQEIISYVNDIPDDFLLAIKPLLAKLSNDVMHIEALDFDDLTKTEKQASVKAVAEYQDGTTVNHDDINWN